jgi:sporulation protein YlmC with PRC-barrel domain
LAMARNDHDNLVRLRDSDFTLEDPWQDIRGHGVYTSDGDQIGTVEDLYVDKDEREVRFLTFESGGFLGTSIGATYRMIPVEAISDVNDDRVTVDFGREKAVGAPAFDADVVPTFDQQHDLYDYYGYRHPDRGVRD